MPLDDTPWPGDGNGIYEDSESDSGADEDEDEDTVADEELVPTQRINNQFCGSMSQHVVSLGDDDDDDICADMGSSGASAGAGHAPLSMSSAEEQAAATDCWTQDARGAWHAPPSYTAYSNGDGEDTSAAFMCMLGVISNERSAESHATLERIACTLRDLEVACEGHFLPDVMLSQISPTFAPASVEYLHAADHVETFLAIVDRDIAKESGNALRMPLARNRDTEDIINIRAIQSVYTRAINFADRGARNRFKRLSSHTNAGAPISGTAIATARARDPYGAIVRSVSDRASWTPLAKHVVVPVSTDHIEEMRLYIAHETSAVVKMCDVAHIICHRVFNPACTSASPYSSADYLCGHSKAMPVPPPRPSWDFHIAAAMSRELKKALKDLRLQYLAVEFIQRVTDGIFAERYKQRIEWKQHEKLWMREPPKFKRTDVLSAAAFSCVHKKKTAPTQSTKRHFV